MFSRWLIRKVERDQIISGERSLLFCKEPTYQMKSRSTFSRVPPLMSDLLEINLDDPDLQYLEADFCEFLERNKALINKMNSFSQLTKTNQQPSTLLKHLPRSIILPPKPPKFGEQRNLPGLVRPNQNSKAVSSLEHIRSPPLTPVFSIPRISSTTHCLIPNYTSSGSTTRTTTNSGSTMLFEMPKSSKGMLPSIIRKGSYEELPVDLDEGRGHSSKDRITFDRQLPGLTCQAWGIFTEDDAEIIEGDHAFEIREMASITKVMTCLVVLKLLKRFEIDPIDFYFTTTPAAIGMRGTSANLCEGGWYTINDLLYGLMLPSGNDAAVCLADNFGYILYFASVGRSELFEDYKFIDIRSDMYRMDYMKLFIKEMNKVAIKLQLRATTFSNVHGLPHRSNKSSCADLAKLISTSLRWKQFRMIVNCKQYLCTYKFDAGDEIAPPIYGTQQWKNTNKLLDTPGFFGVKTGITTTAGSCLASFYQKYIPQLKQTISLIILVLGSIGTDDRFDDTEKILQWYLDKEIKTAVGNH